MAEEYTKYDRFNQQFSHLLQHETVTSPAILIAKNADVYRCGEADRMIYFIESGLIKLIMRSSEDKNCLLAIHATGDMFGELCLSGAGGRLETATAMEETVLKQIPCMNFFGLLAHDSPFMAGFVQFMAVRIADQQQRITNLVTTNSEQRLGRTLLTLARKLGKKYPDNILIEIRISHEELSEMVGTTRPRISVFMQRLRNLGVIETNEDHFLIIKENKLSAYLAGIA